MRSYLEILIYNYKKQNDLDVYSELDYYSLEDLKNEIGYTLESINEVQRSKNSLNKVS